MTRPNKRDDLIDAYTAVEWAQTQLPVLEKAIDSFTTSKPYRIVEKHNPNGEGVLFVLADVKALPPIINAEVGAILNSIRSSLDLLSASLARRNGKTPTRSTNFPIWNNPNEFMDPINGIHGRERKQWLAEGERRIIESLKPHPGGNDKLFALHQLDTIRKHERLVGVHLSAGSIRIEGDAAAAGLARWPNWPRFENDAIVAVGPLGVSERNIHISLIVTLDEAIMPPGLLDGRTLVTFALFDFAQMADAIIRRFDYP